VLSICRNGFGSGATIPEVLAYNPVAGSWNVVFTAPSSMPIDGYAKVTYDPVRGRSIVVADDTFAIGEFTYYYRDNGSAVATYLPFGTGCAGGGGLPSLAAAPGSTPTLGTTFTVQVSNTGGALLAALGVGVSRTVWGAIPLPMPLAQVGIAGCDLLVSPDLVVAMTIPAAGVATAAVAVPNNPLLAGLVFFEQSLLLDPTAPNGVGATSNGAMVIVQ
jgi:hypothetical protein